MVSQWPGGFQANVTVTNGAAARTSWTVAWTFANGQRISQIWNGAYTQNGSAVTVRNVGYNGSLPAAGTTNFGFIGSWTSGNGTPAGITCQ